MGTRKNHKSKKSSKRFRKTRSKRQRGGTKKTPNKKKKESYWKNIIIPSSSQPIPKHILIPSSSQPIPKHILIPSSSQSQPIQQQSHNNDAEVNMDINLPAVVDKQAEDKRVRQDIEKEMKKEIAGYVVQMSHTPVGEVPSLMQPYMDEDKRQQYLRLTREQQTPYHHEYSTHISNQNAKNLYNIVASNYFPTRLINVSDEQKQYYLQLTHNEQLIYLHIVAANDATKIASKIDTAASNTAAESLIDMANMLNINTNVSDTPSIASDETLIDSPPPSPIPSPILSSSPPIRRSQMTNHPTCSLKNCNGGKRKTRRK